MKWFVTVLAVAAVVVAPTAAADAHQSTESCDWVHVDEASEFLGVAAVAEPMQTRLPELSCAYRAAESPQGRPSLESDVRFADAFAWDAATQFATVAAQPGAREIDDVGLRAVCIYEPNVTPPSTTLTALLTGERMYRVTGSYVWPCETLKGFARLAIARIGP